jgi:hypothetical protein
LEYDPGITLLDGVVSANTGKQKVRTQQRQNILAHVFEED